jgi:hypothetical protein
VVWAVAGALAIVGCGGAGDHSIPSKTVTAGNGSSPGVTLRSRRKAARLRARLPACPNSKLLVWNGPGRAGVGLGQVYLQLAIANLSGHACKVSGVPEVVAIDLAGRQVGPPAGVEQNLNPAAAKSPSKNVILTRNGSARFELSWVTPYDYSPSDCHVEMRAGFRVRLPGARNSQRVPYPLAGCSQEVPGLAVGRIE